MNKLEKFTLGDIIHLDPNELIESGNIKIITKEEADKIADSNPKVVCTVTSIGVDFVTIKQELKRN